MMKMFNYKTWKLYSPAPISFDPIDPVPMPDPVVDENGNSITPDSLKKNMTIPTEAPGNDLEKVLSNMNGADPAYPVEGTSGLIKQMNELAGNPPSGGGGIGFVKKIFTFGAGKTIEAGQTATIVAYNGYLAEPMPEYKTKLADWFSCDEKPGLIIISTTYELHPFNAYDTEGYQTTVFNASAQSISVKANTQIAYNLLYQPV
jgi:hypothetical protein